MAQVAATPLRPRVITSYSIHYTKLYEREGQRIISTSFRALETYLAVALIYFVLTNLANQFLRFLERRMQVEGRR